MDSTAGHSFAFEAATAAFIREQDAEREVGPNEPTVDQLREGYADHLRRRSVMPDMSVEARDLACDGPAGAISLRLYTPPNLSPLPSPLLVYVHGGGFAVGDLDSHDALARLLSTEASLRVLTLHYRRAPEAPYPAAREDVVAVYLWARANADALGIDPERIAIGGESAGGTHAAAATLALRDHGKPLPKALWMLVPALDAAAAGESHRIFETGAGRPAAEFQFLWSLYRPQDVEPSDPGLSPVYADLSGLPPVRIYTAEFDPVRSDGEAFAERARSAGVDAAVQCETGLIHQFPEITGVSPASRAAVVRAAGELRALLQ